MMTKKLIEDVVLPRDRKLQLNAMLKLLNRKLVKLSVLLRNFELMLRHVN